MIDETKPETTPVEPAVETTEPTSTPEVAATETPAA